MRPILAIIALRLLGKYSSHLRAPSGESSYAFYTTPVGEDPFPNVLSGALSDRINAALENNKQLILRNPKAFIDSFREEENLIPLLIALLQRDGFVVKKRQGRNPFLPELVGLRGVQSPGNGLGILVCEHDGFGRIDEMLMKDFVECLRAIEKDPHGLVIEEFNVSSIPRDIFPLHGRVYSTQKISREALDVLYAYDGAFDIDVIDGVKFQRWVAKQAQKPIPGFLGDPGV